MSTFNSKLVLLQKQANCDKYNNKFSIDNSASFYKYLIKDAESKMIIEAQKGENMCYILNFKIGDEIILDNGTILNGVNMVKKIILNSNFRNMINTYAKNKDIIFQSDIQPNELKLMFIWIDK